MKKKKQQRYDLQVFCAERDICPTLKTKVTNVLERRDSTDEIAFNCKTVKGLDFIVANVSRENVL